MGVTESLQTAVPRSVHQPRSLGSAGGIGYPEVSGVLVHCAHTWYVIQRWAAGKYEGKVTNVYLTECERQPVVSCRAGEVTHFIAGQYVPVLRYTICS